MTIKDTIIDLQNNRYFKLNLPIQAHMEIVLVKTKFCHILEKSSFSNIILTNVYPQISIEGIRV